MIEILTPLSKYVDLSNPSSYTLTWNDSSEAEQYAYEIMYKYKSGSDWATSGKITSTAKSYDLRNIRSYLDLDFKEIHYKIKLYVNRVESTSTTDKETTGTEISNVFSLIFDSGSIGNLKVKCDANTIKSFPVFDTVNNDNPKWKVKSNDGQLLVPLVEEDNPVSSGLKIKVADNNVLTVPSHDNSHFSYYTPQASDVWGEFDVDGGEETTSIEPAYYYYSKEYQTSYYYYSKEYQTEQRIQRYQSSYNYYYTQIGSRTGVNVPTGFYGVTERTYNYSYQSSSRGPGGGGVSSYVVFYPTNYYTCYAVTYYNKSYVSSKVVDAGGSAGWSYNSTTESYSYYTSPLAYQATVQETKPAYYYYTTQSAYYYYQRQYQSAYYYYQREYQPEQEVQEYRTYHYTYSV